MTKLSIKTILLFFIALLLFSIDVFSARKNKANPIKLSDNGGFHFLHEGSSYVFIIHTNGVINFIPKDFYDNPKSLRELNEKMNFHCYLREKKGKKETSSVPIQEVKTEIQQSKTSFTVIYQVTFEGNHLTKTIFKGSSKQVNIQTITDFPNNYDLNYRFSIPETNEEKENGLLNLVTTSNKKLKLKCQSPFLEKYDELDLKQVQVQKRNFEHVLFKAKSKDETLHINQRSHNQGASLNHPFYVIYRNNKEWSQSKNLLTLAF